jgi:hypothetical protein
MASAPRSDEEAAQAIEHAITRLVDGTLSGADREALEAWAEANPEVSRQVVAQREVARELASGGPEAPDRLLDAVEERVRVRRGPRRRGAAAARGGRAGALFGWRSAAVFGALAAAALVIVLAVGAFNSGTNPSITAAAKLADVPAKQPAPAVRDAHYLDLSYGGVTFPNYARLDAVATGKLTNKIGGRPAVTVYYHLRDGSRLSYTVFSGSPVPVPANARQVLIGPDSNAQYVPLHVYRTANGLTVVTLVRNGSTCVLAARTGEDVVIGLAAEPITSA